MHLIKADIHAGFCELSILRWLRTIFENTEFVDGGRLNIFGQYCTEPIHELNKRTTAVILSFSIWIKAIIFQHTIPHVYIAKASSNIAPGRGGGMEEGEFRGEIFSYYVRLFNLKSGHPEAGLRPPPSI